MRIAVGQLCSSSNVVANANIVKKIIHKAIGQKAQVLFLPEATDYIAKDASHSIQLASQTNSSFLKIIRDELLQLKSNLYISVGIHEPSANANRVQNNQVWINPKGDILQTYQKIHLFDVEIANGPILKESNSVEPGNKILPPFDIYGTKFKLGMATCYDIRFGDLSIILRKMGADIITFPSAFTTKTGEAHWKTLGQARAIDSQCFVVMAAQCGKHDVYADQPEGGANGTKRISYGNSLVISPWGEILAQGKAYSDDLTPDVDPDGDYYELITADLQYDQLQTIRQNMPLLKHRREDIYNSV
jgi:beta-ureidopropionase